MRSVSKASVLKSVIIGGAIGAVVMAMQVHLWQARANSRQAAPASSMSSFIEDLHSSGYIKTLPVQVIEDLN